VRPATGRVTRYMPLFSRIVLAVAVGLVALVAAALLARAPPRDAKRAEKLHEARTRELAELSTYLQNFAEQERSELARKLHDELGGLLTAAKWICPGCRRASTSPPTKGASPSSVKPSIRR
jgi:signal transduction histidine kinase